MTLDPWQSVTPDDEPPQAALAGVDLAPKHGGYSLADILQLHDTASHDGPTGPEPAGLPTVGSVAGPTLPSDVSAVLTLSPAADDEPYVSFTPAPKAAPMPAPVPTPTPPAAVAAPMPAAGAPMPAAGAPMPAAGAPMPAMNPFAAFSMPKPAAQTGPKPAKRGGLPVISPSEFAAAPVDRIDPVPAPEQEPTPTDIAPPSAVQLHALHQSLAALDELEAQLGMLGTEPVASEASDWVDALATAAGSPSPIPVPTDERPKALIGPTTADDVVAEEPIPFTPTPIERLEPAVQFPFPGMSAYSEDAAGSPVEAPPLNQPVHVAHTATTAGDPPFFFHLDGEPIDLATDMGIAACEEAARSAIADAGRAVQTMLDGLQRQRRMQDLMARVHAGGLGVDEVIGLGQELQHLKDEIGLGTVDRLAVSELVARLEQQRALMGRLIDLLWRS